MKIPGRATGDHSDTQVGATDKAPADGRDASLHRVRVGVTGLAVVFLLTILAAAMLSLFGQDDHGTTRLANGTVVANSALPPEAPKEPLAELGVAPGNVPSNSTTPVLASKQVAAPTSAPAAAPEKPASTIPLSPSPHK